MVELNFVDAGEALRERIGREWGPVVAAHMHLSQGYALVALDAGDPVGLISIAWRELPPPLAGVVEAFIDIIEVRADWRRRGVGRRLVELAAERARAAGAYQLRAWSSEDKTEAIPMWRALGFGLCPATTYPRGIEVKGYFVARLIRMIRLKEPAADHGDDDLIKACLQVVGLDDEGRAFLRRPQVGIRKQDKDNVATSIRIGRLSHTGHSCPFRDCPNLRQSWPGARAIAKPAGGQCLDSEDRRNGRSER